MRLTKPIDTDEGRHFAIGTLVYVYGSLDQGLTAEYPTRKNGRDAILFAVDSTEIESVDTEQE
jgi:hypothetical protein